MDLQNYTLHFHDQAGRSIRTESYDGDGTLTGVYESIYEGTRLVRTVSTAGAGGINYETFLTYDGHDRLVRAERFSGGALTEYQTYRYDNLGRQTELAYYGANGERFTHVEYKYVGQQMSPIEEITTYQGQWQIRVRWSYDTLGNQVSGVQSTGSGPECTVFRRKYEGHRIVEETNYATDCSEYRFVRYEYEPK